MTNERTFAQLAAGYPADVQRLAAKARAFVRELLPGSKEQVDASGPYVGYGYAPGYTGRVCTLILSQRGLKLGLFGGADLADPHDLLEGAGKRHRHIVVRAPEDLTRRGVKDLIRAAHRAQQARV